jgi:hypothetical protein
MRESFETIKPGDERLIWSGAVSLQHESGWVMPWRLPHKDLALFPPQPLQDCAAMPSGVRLRFATDAETLEFHTEPMPGAGNLDLYAGDALLSTVAFEAGETAAQFDGLPKGMKTLELWLPTAVPFRLRAVQLPVGARLERSEDRRPKWITYGSSITHCLGAGSPSFTWPGVVARAKGLNLLSLGYGGQCHADPMLARLMRDLPADFVSVKIGINIQGHGSLNIRSFLPAVIGTLVTIREKHPDIPLVVCSPIWSPPRETAPNAAGMSLEIMRQQVAKAVDILRERGDKLLYYVDGLKLFGPEHAEFLPDLVHPDAEGYLILGRNFVREVFDRIGVQLPSETKATQH